MLKARRTTRPERKDVDIVRRAVMAYLYSIGLTQRELASIFNLSQSRVKQILAYSQQPTPQPYNTWRHSGY